MTNITKLAHAFCAAAAAEAERKFFSQDFYEEAREGKKPWPDQRPATVKADRDAALAAQQGGSA